jgi:hypothetical protein
MTTLLDCMCCLITMWRNSHMHELVKDYYGRHLQGTADLRTSACCDASGMPAWLKPLLARIHPR